MNCLKCTSDATTRKAFLEDKNENIGKRLQLRLDQDPGAFLFKGTERFTVSCRVCLECGHIELTCDDVAGLRKSLSGG